MNENHVFMMNLNLEAVEIVIFVWLSENIYENFRSSLTFATLHQRFWQLF